MAVYRRLEIQSTDKQFLHDFINWLSKYPRTVIENSVVLRILVEHISFKEGDKILVSTSDAVYNNEIQISRAEKALKGTFVRYRTKEERKEWRQNDDCIVMVKEKPETFRHARVIDMKRLEKMFETGKDGIERVYPSIYLSLDLTIVSE